MSVTFEAAGEIFIVNQLRQENEEVKGTGVIIRKAIWNETEETSEIKRVNRDLTQNAQTKHECSKNII